MMKTPIYVEMTMSRGWDPLSQTHPSLVDLEKQVEGLRPMADSIPTPLIDDAVRNGVKPWDSLTREAFEPTLAQYRTGVTKSKRPRPPRAKRAVPPVRR